MIILFAIFIPIILGAILPFLKFDKNIKNVYAVVVAVVTSIVVFYLIVHNILVDIVILKLNEVLSIGFKIDGLSKIFLMIISFLWPLATLYATEYMEKEENQDSFFRYYLITYGITIAVATSRNIISMYLFYELLTFITLPLIMHKQDKQSFYAGKIYLILSILGAATALIGMIIFVSVIGNIEFKYMGLVDEFIRILENPNYINNNLIKLNKLYISYLLMFLGFGVKSAIIPFSIWLPLCSVAPTPVSALLHAVAVVKSGVFAIMRITYYIFDVSILVGSNYQKILLCIVIATILYGSIMAVKDRHIKRRLAYSTVSNLSYILLMLLLMSKEGLSAGITHMMFHAIIKINLFFAAGNIMIYSKRENVSEMKGIAKKMPITMLTFLISSLALIGIPLTCGFISKYAIITTLIDNQNVFSYVGLIAIIISSVLTLIYTFEIIIPAYFIGDNFDIKKISKIQEAGVRSKIVMIVLVILIIYFGINSTSILSYIELVSSGI